MCDIYEWNELEKLKPFRDGWIKFKDCDLIIGNGASIAIYEKFNYKSLYDYCKGTGLLDGNAINLFKELNTVDFEQLLYACIYAKSVNKSLNSDTTDIDHLYESIKESLIKAVQEIHPSFNNELYSKLRRVGIFTSRFRKIFSLNYDLLFYWAMMEYNHHNKNAFKDGFIDGSFTPSVLPNVFFPHGNLMLINSDYGSAKKIRARKYSTVEQTELLDTIIEEWKNGATPLFISEGDSKKKLNSISRNAYLSISYRELSKPNYGKNIVFIYGFSFSNNDEHILNALKEREVKQLYISVYTGEGSKPHSFCRDVSHLVEKVLPSTQVVFFNALSSDCWSY